MTGIALMDLANLATGRAAVAQLDRAWRGRGGARWQALRCPMPNSVLQSPSEDPRFLRQKCPTPSLPPALAGHRYTSSIAGQISLTNVRRFGSGDIVERLDKKVTTVVPICNALIAKGMLCSPAHGDTAFTVPLSDGFMKRAPWPAEWPRISE
jgi:hypothetical protein